MKKPRFILLNCMLLAMLLCGCGQGDAASQETPVGGTDTFTGDMEPSLEKQIRSAETLFSSELLLEEEEWRDNTLDDYTAVIHVPLLSRQQEEFYGSWNYAMGSTRGAALLKHFPESAEGLWDAWDEFRTITDQGEKGSVRLAFREDTNNQAWGIGSIIGSDHFMMLDMDTSEMTGAGRQYRFFEIDENAQKVRTVELDFLPGDGGETPDEFIVDRTGNIHFVTTWDYVAGSDLDKQSYYYITDADGTPLVKLDYSGIFTRLVTLYDGRVAIWSQLVDDQGGWTGSRLESVDAGTGEVTLLVENTFSQLVYYTLWDEKTLLYADVKGLHFADLSGERTGDLYLWGRHGIRFERIEEIRIGEDGHINLIYYDNKYDGNLLCLKPTEEEVEIQTIILATKSIYRDLYSPVVAEFNKRYPTYRIELRTNYEETTLLTELMAGKGPVLIDTWYTGFDNHKELWAPLEGLFAGEQWEDVLIPQAMELGKIDGTQYGIVNSFGLKTVVISEDEPTDWDYEAFLNCIEGATSIQAVSDGYNTLGTFVSYFTHGLEDNYLLDAESGTTYFDSDEFRRVLELGMKYHKGYDDYIWTEGSLREGEVFCNNILITKPEEIDMYRINYGEDFNYIGYPTENGSAHYITSLSSLAIRSTASDEEKRIAGAFLRLLLSRECQQDITITPNFWLSVRRDVLEEQIQQVNEMSIPVRFGFTQITLGDDYDREYDARILYDLLERARPEKNFPRELSDILAEELGEYESGKITEDVLIDRLTKRVGLYLAEQS